MHGNDFSNLLYNNLLFFNTCIFHSFLLFNKSHKITLVLFSTSLILQTISYPSDTYFQVPQDYIFTNLI